MSDAAKAPLPSRRRGAQARPQSAPPGRKPRTAAKNAPEKRPRGRPKNEPTAAQIKKVERFAELGLDMDDIACAIDFPRSTFYKYRESHFLDALKRGRAKLKLTTGKAFLRELRNGNIGAGIWLEKTRLGVTEKVHAVVPDAMSGGGALVGQGVIAVGIYLPANGREVEVPGSPLPRGAEVRVVPADEVQVMTSTVLALPANGRERAPP